MSGRLVVGGYSCFELLGWPVPKLANRRNRRRPLVSSEETARKRICCQAPAVPCQSGSLDRQINEVIEMREHKVHPTYLSIIILSFTVCISTPVAIAAPGDRDSKVAFRLEKVHSASFVANVWHG